MTVQAHKAILTELITSFARSYHTLSASLSALTPHQLYAERIGVLLATHSPLVGYCTLVVLHGQCARVLRDFCYKLFAKLLFA